MNAPRILVPVASSPCAKEQKKFGVGENYINALVHCGALPLLVPVTISLEEQRRLLFEADGLLLTGGGDVDPARYGESPHEAVYGVSEARDEAELNLVRWAVEADKPLFAICRGIQVMNVALGGSLIQDLPTQAPSPIVHRGNNDDRDEPVHPIRVQAQSRLAGILGTEQTRVNSFHHQAVKQIADGLVPIAHAPDGVIEAVEMPGRRHVLGVQWHPEEMAQDVPAMMRLFEAFVAACRER